MRQSIGALNAAYFAFVTEAGGDVTLFLVFGQWELENILYSSISCSSRCVDYDVGEHEPLSAKTSIYFDWIIGHARPDGWYGWNHPRVCACG
jgi:hypothetical protein